MEIFRTEFRAMGGANEIVLAAPEQAVAAGALEAAVREVLRIEAKYSRYRDDSVVSRINAMAGSGQWVPVDDETHTLLGFADALYRQSDGLFDITSGILRQAWDFRAKTLPDQSQLDQLLTRIGWQRVERQDEAIRLPAAGMEIDFGGFGKEYAADRAATLLEERGVAHGYVNLGGDIRAMGPQPDGVAWLIGVQNPRRPGEVIATIPVRQGALATSGDYERYFEHKDRRYCHVLDPRTGWPVSHWSSVSVLAPLAVVAGSYATITMLKQESGLDFLRAAGMTHLCVDADGTVFST
jgi:thiamine biosynthesis lipoprotein